MSRARHFRAYVAHLPVVLLLSFLFFLLLPSQRRAALLRWLAGLGLLLALGTLRGAAVRPLSLEPGPAPVVVATQTYNL